MNRRGGQDVVVVGGGVVGATCALGLARQGLQVTLVESRTPVRWVAERADLRVYAFAQDNTVLLQSLGVWEAVRAARAQPYRAMRVWDAAGGGELVFDADKFGRQELGWIIEHALLVDCLWTALPHAGVQLHADQVEGLEQDAHGVRLRLQDGDCLQARLVVAADGASSTLRQLAGLRVSGHDYAQGGLVAYVQTELPHHDTAWQRFLPGGPLAFLPVMQGRSSIVWSLPTEEAQMRLSQPSKAFEQALTRAFEGRLGNVTLESERALFPLRRQLAKQYVAGRVMLMGDAAHVVHPLAGQGVNLGLRDVSGWLDQVRQAQARGVDWATPHRLARWARVRNSENRLAAYAFDGVNALFSTDELHATLVRGMLLGLTGKLPPLTRLLWARAAGV